MLRQLKLYLQLNQQVSLHDVMVHFSIDEEQARELMQHWIRKSCVEKVDAETCKDPCVQCHPAALERYAWVG
ncbi:MAG: hypothetical protein DHS20C10_12330 [marine bacterium B5-7]|nr:MAG: hypothetical protein DHS20C10_12330 [marine bacterium B5-7]